MSSLRRRDQAGREDLQALSAIRRESPRQLADGSRPAPQLPPLVLELRSFLVTKKLVEPAKIDHLLASRNTNDAAALIRQLAVLGTLTQVQADALIAEFHQRQMASARGVISAAPARGFIPSPHVEHALASYAPMAFSVSIHDHLVGSGLLTREQADGLHRSGAATGKLMPRIAVVSLLIVGGIVVLVAMRSDPPKIDEDCTMNGLGVGQCNFTNRGGSTGSVCGQITVTCNRQDRSSGSFCSGDVKVKESHMVEFRVAGIGDITNYDWRKECNFQFFSE